MAQASWPAPGHNARAVTDLEYEQMAARFSDDGVYGSPTDTAVVTAGTGLTVSVRPNVTGSVRGHGWTSGGTALSLPVDANAGGSARVDWVVLRLDRSDWSVQATIRKGTPGSGAPTLVQDTGDTGVYEIPLALATVPSGTGTVTVTRAELYVGARIRPCTSTTRNPLAPPGEMGYELNTGRLILRTRTGWAIVFDSPGEVSIDAPQRAGWGIVINSYLEKQGNIVTLRLGTWSRVAPAIPSSDESALPVLIPDAYRHPTRNHYVLAYKAPGSIAYLTIYSKANTDRAGQVWLTSHGGIDRNDHLTPQTGQSWVVA